MSGSWLGGNKGYVVAIAIALVFIIGLVAGYYLWFRGEPEPYSTISILDADGLANDYPEIVVIGENNSFTVWVTVENHMGEDLSFEVRIKVTTQKAPVFPIQEEATTVFPITLRKGEKWSTTATTTLELAGDYMIVYELWMRNNTGAFKFTGNACVLNVEAIS
jgi:uncharacterized membrane protein